MELVFATNNKNKIKEIQQVIGGEYKILSLDDIGCKDELPETQITIKGNALQKARYVYDKYQLNCFADDTGLEIEALGGKPGIFSARYAGEGRNADDNMNKVLAEMKGVTNRVARFITVIALLMNGGEHFFEGIVTGTILTQKQGDKGFGYDPIFMPESFTKSFAEMTIIEKNQISHRALATRQLTSFLSK